MKRIMNALAREAAAEVLTHMDPWLRLSPKTYTPSVMLFALQLPPDKLIEALWVAQSRKPEGGVAAFKYFCGVCHTMRRELSDTASRN